jgi:serine/threonine-protein kinase
MCGETHAPYATCRLSDSRIGEVLGDKYRLIRLIGQGGMGSVYEAQHAFVGRKFAVKLLRPECATIPEAVARFHREATAVAEVESKHIVGVFDFGLAASGSPYIVMEYLTGEDCRSALRRAGTLPAARAAQIVGEACKGLETAHRLDIVHRDLKPENLFIAHEPDGAEVVKVLDFGIAKLRHRATTLFATQAGAVMGTAVYMSPEQARESRDVDHRTDIYSLGATLYEMVSGRPPHDGETFAGIIFSILRQEPSPLEALCPNLPARFGDVVRKAMAKEPAERYQSARELRDALAPYCQRFSTPEAGWAPQIGVLPTAVAPASTGPTPQASAAAAHVIPSVVGQTSTHKSAWEQSGSVAPRPAASRAKWLWWAAPALFAAMFGLGVVGYRLLRSAITTPQPPPAGASAAPLASSSENAVSAQASANNPIATAASSVSNSALAAASGSGAVAGARAGVRPAGAGRELPAVAKPSGSKNAGAGKDDLFVNRR